MWYEDGTIKYQLEAGANSRSGELGTVDNPYRLIKYVVVNPQRSGDLPMVDLRLYQLSVVSGFRVPTEDPVEFTAPLQATPEEDSDMLSTLLDDANTDQTEMSLENSRAYYWCDWDSSSFWPQLLVGLFDFVSGLLNTMVSFCIDLLGHIVVFCNTIADCFLTLVDVFAEVDILFSIGNEFATFLTLWEAAYFAWFTFDVLRASMAGLTACAGAALAAVALSLCFYIVIEAWVSYWISVGASIQKVIEYFAVMFVVFCINNVLPFTDWSTTFTRWGFKLALCTTNMLSVGTWNVVWGVGRILFILSTLAYLIYKINYYHDLI